MTSASVEDDVAGLCKFSFERGLEACRALLFFDDCNRQYHGNLRSGRALLR